MKHLGVGKATITDQGQLSLTVALEESGFVPRDEPIVWAVTEDRSKAVLSRTRDAVDTDADLSVCGTAIPDADRVVSVPVPVFETVNGIEPGVEVAFVTNRDLADQGLVYVVPMDAVYDEFPEISRGRPGKRF